MTMTPYPREGQGCKRCCLVALLSLSPSPPLPSSSLGPVNSISLAMTTVIMVPLFDSVLIAAEKSSFHIANDTHRRHAQGRGE